MDGLPGQTPAVWGPSRQGLRVALLASRGEQQLPVGKVRSSRAAVNERRELSAHAGSHRWEEEATHHQHKLQTPASLGPWARSGLRGLISRAEGLPQKSGLRVLFLIFF